MGKVSIKGDAKNVTKAMKEVLSIVQCHHSSVLEPDKVHEELDIEAWQRPYVIGKGGTEIRHIRDTFGTEIYLADDKSLDDTSWIVGKQDKVEGAKAYIEKLLETVEGKRPKADDE